MEKYEQVIVFLYYLSLYSMLKII